MYYVCTRIISYSSPKLILYRPMNKTTMTLETTGQTTEAAQVKVFTEDLARFDTGGVT